MAPFQSVPVNLMRSVKGSILKLLLSASIPSGILCFIKPIFRDFDYFVLGFVSGSREVGGKRMNRFSLLS